MGTTREHVRWGEIRHIYDPPPGRNVFCILLESLTLYNRDPILHLNEKVMVYCIVCYFDYPSEASIRNIVHSLHNIFQKPSYGQQLSEIKLAHNKPVILEYLTEVLSIGKTLTLKR
jgi:hypothetical protein